MSAEGKAVGKAAEHLIAKAVERAGVRESRTIVARITTRIEHAGAQSVRDAEALAVRDALAHGERRTPQQILHDLKHEQASRLTESQRDRVSQALQAARRNEQVLTPQLRDIASRSGMGMEGLDNWAGPTGYRGVNSTWSDPATGQRFELQFHTPESLTAKEVAHPIYDLSRVADPDRLEDGLTSVYRLREGAPLLTLEMAGFGAWGRSDTMYRVHYRGTIDEFHEVDRECAAAVLQRYLELGYFKRIPDLDAPGPDDEFVAAAEAADADADAAWRDVRTPPGAGNIGD